MEKNLKNNPLIEKMKSAKEVVWINPDKIPFSEAEDKLHILGESRLIKPMGLLCLLGAATRLDFFEFLRFGDF